MTTSRKGEERRKAMKALIDAADKRIRGQITPGAFAEAESVAKKTKAARKRLPPTQ